MSVFSFHIFVLLICSSKKWDIKRIVTLLFSYMWQKFNKMNEKRSLMYQGVGTEFVTGQINIT